MAASQLSVPLTDLQLTNLTYFIMSNLTRRRLVPLAILSVFTLGAIPFARVLLSTPSANAQTTTSTVSQPAAQDDSQADSAKVSSDTSATDESHVTSVGETQEKSNGILNMSHDTETSGASDTESANSATE
jgi:hypothetical protein